MGNFNIDLKNEKIGLDKLNGMCDTFNLTNLIKSEICCFSQINLGLFNKLMLLGWVIITNSFLHFSNRDFQKLDQSLENRETTRTSMKIFFLMI